MSSSGDTARAHVKQCGEVVEKLKASNASVEEIKRAVGALQLAKEALQVIVQGERGAETEEAARAMWIREGLDKVLLGRFFVVPSFEIYGGVSGLFDFGPPGCMLKDNIISAWRRHFVLEEMMLEVSTSTLTTQQVLKTSGHVDKFTDFMVRDDKTGDCFRADKLLEDHIDALVLGDAMMSDADRRQHLSVKSKADDYDVKQLHEKLTEYGVKAPGTNNGISEPFPFNLMFETQIGPMGKSVGYMRPETAQGIFTNFKRLLEYNGAKLPFASAQIGTAYRNEISPRAGLLRVREFTLAEIEHFVHPEDKSHHKFARVAETVLPLLPKTSQGDGVEQVQFLPAADAVSSGMVDNETLAYFMVRTYMFLTQIGMKTEFIRFRQHKDNEMAHYATDCWDAEIKSSYGWIECVGHADRSAFDLKAHAKVTKVDLSAHIVYDEPRIVDKLVRNINRGKLGPMFRKDAKKVVEILEGYDHSKAMAVETTLASEGSLTVSNCDGEEFVITRDMVSYKIVSEKTSGEKFVPGVIEPSFGIGRILYSLLEHAFWVRDNDEDRRVLSFRPRIAPIKVAILPLSNNAVFAPFSELLTRELLDLGIVVNCDSSSAAIGRRYARADEVGVPFCVTIDFDTVAKESVTIRDRDSLNQIRVEVSQVSDVLAKLTSERLTWEEAYNTYPRFFAQESV